MTFWADGTSSFVNRSAELKKMFLISLSVLNVIRVFEIKFRIRNFFMHTKHGFLTDTVKLTRSISFNDSS